MLLLSSISAMAIPALRLSDGTNEIIIHDNGAFDSATEAGVVSFAGLFAGQLSVTVGITKPVANSAPLMTLNDVTVLGGSGTLIIDFSETDFAPGFFDTLLASIGGTTNSTVSYYTYYSPSNELFGLTHQITAQGPFVGLPNTSSFGGPLGNGDTSGTLNPTGAFSLTQRVVIQRNGGRDNTGFNATLSAPPVPDGGSTVALLGMFMVGLAGCMKVTKRDRRRANGAPSASPQAAAEPRTP